MGDKGGERSLIRDAEFEPLNSIESERKMSLILVLNHVMQLIFLIPLRLVRLHE